jgi:hypothetical protein
MFLEMSGSLFPCFFPCDIHLVSQEIYIFIYKQVVCHTMALPFTLKCIYLKAKEKLCELKYLTAQKYNLQKILQKEKKKKPFKIL